MKKKHVTLIAAAAVSLILGVIMIAVAVVLTSSSDSAQPEVETQTEMVEPASTGLTDAEYFKSMPEDQQVDLIAIICLATEQGNTSEEIAEAIANNFDAISEDYADSLVTAATLTVCKGIAE